MSKLHESKNVLLTSARLLDYPLLCTGTNGAQSFFRESRGLPFLQQLGFSPGTSKPSNFQSYQGLCNGSSLSNISRAPTTTQTITKRQSTKSLVTNPKDGQRVGMLMLRSISPFSITMSRHVQKNLLSLPNYLPMFI